MRSIMQDIQSGFQKFIGSGRQKILIVPCEPEHSAFLLKSLEAMEDDPASPDIFLIFGHSFANSKEYISQILPTIKQQIFMVNQELVKRDDAELSHLPEELPAEVSDEAQPPAIRLVKLMRHIEGLAGGERRVIWVLYPLEMDDPGGYLQLVTQIQVEFESKSLTGTKVIVRDNVDSPVLTPKLADRPQVAVYRPELDPQSFERKLNEKANDPRIPVEEQAQMHMMLAGFDVANQRYDMALARNLELLGYFRGTGQQHQQAVVLNNIGDLHYTQSNFKEAQTWYEQAVKLSVGLKSHPLVLYQSMNLGNTMSMQGKFADALTYYQATEQLARASNLPVQEIQALEQIGIVNYRMGNPSGAVESWEKAVELSRELQFNEGERTNLNHLRDLYRELGNSKRLAACEAELKKIGSPHESHH